MTDSSPDSAARIAPAIDDGWYAELEPEFRSAYFARLKEFLVDERARHRVYPKGSDIFAAFQRTPFERVRVVILGQDPYHGPGQAHGLSFSVPPGVPVPPSLRNMFVELQRDLGIPPPASGDLGRWAEQGVLLLNATLTVRAHEAGSHQGKGWERFTDAAIQRLSEQHAGLVFLLWGRYAHQKVSLIDATKHTILQAPHPSPLSAHRGFIGCGHFGTVNRVFAERGLPTIDWTP
jgi:uracil-DNA glycosylase